MCAGNGSTVSRHGLYRTTTAVGTEDPADYSAAWVQLGGTRAEAVAKISVSWPAGTEETFAWTTGGYYSSNVEETFASTLMRFTKRNTLHASVVSDKVTTSSRSK